MLAHLNATNHDFLAIVVSGLYVENLLGLSTMSAGSGTLMGQEVVKFVIE